MADARYHHTARPWYSGFDCACMGMNVGNIGVAYEKERRYPDLVQPGESRLRAEWIIGVIHILRIRGEQIEKALPRGIVTRRNQVFVFGPLRDSAFHVTFVEELEGMFAAVEEMLGVRHPANDRTDQNQLLNDLGMSKCEIDRQFTAMGAADERSVIYLQIM